VDGALDRVAVVVQDDDEWSGLVVDHAADFLDRELQAAVAGDEDGAVARTGRGLGELLQGEIGAEGGGRGPADAAVVGLREIAGWYCQDVEMDKVVEGALR